MITASTVRRMAMTALQNGGFHPSDMPTLVEWDISGRCQSPATRLIHARDETRSQQKWLSNPGSMSMILHAPCRKCPVCLEFRANHWRRRAQVEIELSRRTWFATFTLSPEEHHLMWLRICKSQRAKNGGALPALDLFEAYKLRTAAFGSLLTDYIKRVRKQSGTSLRYLLVSEAHESGLPHYHAFIHETAEPVAKRLLQRQWPHGFTTFKLVEQSRKAAWYVCKYISKSEMARCRASLNYGKPRTPSGIVEAEASDVNKISLSPKTQL